LGSQYFKFNVISVSAFTNISVPEFFNTYPSISFFTVFIFVSAGRYMLKINIFTLGNSFLISGIRS